MLKENTQVEDLILKTDAIIYIHTSVNKVVFILIMFLSRGKWVPVTMAWRILRLQMEEQPAVGRVAVNVLNKQSQTAKKGWSYSFGVWRGAINFSV
jgi:hypothetical protein